ncbi:MAG: hypothetical protein AAB599_02400 [Patescibacteria group bacterium]
MRTITKILLTFFVLRFTLSFITWHPDINNHVDWGIRFFEYWPEKFYRANVWSFTWPNQPPGTIYMFAGIRKLFEWVFSFFWSINISVPAFPSNIMLFFEKTLYQSLLKLPSILADLGIAYLIYKLLQEKKKKIAILGATIFLANPVVWYNSTIWGQTDSVISFFALLSVFFLLQKKIFWALLFIALSLYIKISLIIFVPILILFALKQKYSISGWIVGLVGIAAIFIIPSLPFVPQGKSPFVWIFEIYKDKVLTQQLHVITANAFNLWAAIAGIHERPDTTLLGPFPYRTWGNMLFGLSYLPALFLVFKKQTLNSIVWALGLVSFSSFMLATNMHERYIYPLFPYLTILVAQNSILLPIYIIVSTISLLGMYNFWWFPRIEPIVKIMSMGDRILPRILGLINFFSFILFYKRFLAVLKK